MTDKEKIKAEIEKVKLIIQSSRAKGAFAEGYLIGQESILEHFENFVNSMQEEPVNEDLEKAIDKYLDNGKALRLDWRQCNIEVKPDGLRKFAKHFFELGLKAQKGE